MLGRDLDQDVHMVGQKMAFFNTTLLLRGQPAEHLTLMLAQISVKHFPAIFWDKNYMVLALPFRAT